MSYLGSFPFYHFQIFMLVALRDVDFNLGLDTCTLDVIEMPFTEANVIEMPFTGANLFILISLGLLSPPCPNLNPHLVLEFCDIIFDLVLWNKLESYLEFMNWVHCVHDQSGTSSAPRLNNSSIGLLLSNVFSLCFFIETEVTTRAFY